MTNDARIVLSTAASESEAKTIARALVTEKLAACVNIVPHVTSIYAWKGAVEESTEVLLVIKTVAERFVQLSERLRELHSYEVPECIALEVSAGLEPYLAWIRESTHVGK